MVGYGRSIGVWESTSSQVPALKSSGNRAEFYRAARSHLSRLPPSLFSEFLVFHHMVQEVRRTIFRHGLAFYGTVAFVAGFLGARLFATLNPRVVVVQNGIHFHHFWYGLAMVIAAGWIGIALSNVWLGRNLAIVFASENWQIGFVFIGLGILVFLWGFERKRETTSLRSLASELTEVSPA